MADKIQVRQGDQADLPTLDAGEPGFCVDTGRLYIGGGPGGNVLIGPSSEIFTDGYVTQAEFNTALDGYYSKVEMGTILDGYGTAAFAAANIDGYDGYIGVFVGADGITGDPFFVWNRSTRRLVIRSGLEIYHNGTDGYISTVVGGLNLSPIEDFVKVNAQLDAYGDIVIHNANRLLLEQFNTPSTPAIAFGDGKNTGIYEKAADQLAFSTAGVERAYFLGGYFSGTLGARLLMTIAPSSTVPTLMPSVSDTDTGIGSATGDQLSIIAGAKEGIRITENGSSIVTDIYDYAGSVTLSLYHDGSDGYISTSSGGLVLEPTDGYAKIIGDLEVYGQSYSVIGPTVIPAATHQTINWEDGNAQTIDLEDASGDIILTLQDPRAGASYILKIIQDSATPRDIVWPADVTWPDGITPTISTGANAIDIVSLFYDGSTYYANIGQNYS